MDCESSVKHKSELILKLEAKTESMANTIQQLDDKVRQESSARRTSEEGARSAGQRAAAADARAAAAEGDLRLEKEWKTSLQETMVKDRERISVLSDEIESLKVIGQKYVHLREEQHVLRGKYAEAQRTLEEVGATLSSDRLRLAELMEANTAIPTGSRAWADDRDAAGCSSCDKEFNITRRKHHCRRCGGIFCGACSERTAALAGGARPVRVCDACHAATANDKTPTL